MAAPPTVWMGDLTYIPTGEGWLYRERLHGMEFNSYREAKVAALDWLIWCNGSRVHSTPGYLSPTQFEQYAKARMYALAA